MKETVAEETWGEEEVLTKPGDVDVEGGGDNAKDGGE